VIDITYPGKQWWLSDAKPPYERLHRHPTVSTVSCMKQLMLRSVREPEPSATAPASARRAQRRQARALADTASPRYKWIALSNTTLGVLIATINSSILLIALPDIFKGVQVNPLAPANTSLLLWLIMGYLVVTAVLVVSFGRLGDMFGRVRMYTRVLPCSRCFPSCLPQRGCTAPQAPCGW
jgi:hypothetical protein